MSAQTQYCAGCRCYSGGGPHACFESLRAKAADCKAIAVTQVAEVARLRAALERLYLDAARVLYPEGGRVAPGKP